MKALNPETMSGNCTKCNEQDCYCIERKLLPYRWIGVQEYLELYGWRRHGFIFNRNKWRNRFQGERNLTEDQALKIQIKLCNIKI